MADGDINYETYSDIELREALISIDRANFPLNFRNLRAAIQSRGNRVSSLRQDRNPPVQPVERPRTSEPEAAPEIVEFMRGLGRLTPRTPVTYALIAINVAIFIAMAIAGAGVLVPDAQVHIKWGSNLVPVTVDGEWWRLATSMFLHFGLFHVLVNMWVLYANGQLVERLYGSARFLMLYLVAGLAGGMASAAWHPAVNSAGASGAVFGVLGGMVAFLLAKRFRVPRAVIKAQGASIAVFVMYNVMYGLSHSGIDNAAHLGGFVAGVLIGLALARPIEAEARAAPQTLKLAGIAIAALLLLVAAANFVQLAKRNLAPEDRYNASALWFDYHEAGVLAHYNATVAEAKSDGLSDAEFADGLAAEVVPFYEKAVNRLRWEPLEPGPYDEARNQVGRYVALRYESMVMLERALRAGDQEGAMKAMGILHQADELAARIVETTPQKNRSNTP